MSIKSIATEAIVQLTKKLASISPNVAKKFLGSIIVENAL